MSTGQIPDPVEHVSAFAFDVTIDRLIAAIKGAGMTVFARIDHAANAAQVGMNMPPTSVLIYGNARGGTPIMQAMPPAALDLPLRVLVREDGQRTLIAFHPVVAMLQQVGVPADLADRLGPAQNLLIKAIQR
jgi:uncharacterized protein (DUF302 family)